MYAAISADIVSSTSLTKEGMVLLNQNLKELISKLETLYSGMWGRIVRGDTIELILNNPANALEVALILKSYMKSINSQRICGDSDFCKYGLRLAVGIGEMKTNDKKLDMMDGEAIYRSGRALDGLVGRKKYSFVISMQDENITEMLQTIFSLINHILNAATKRQCQVLYERLVSKDAKEVANNLDITASGVNQTLKTVGWTAIERAILFYQKTFESIC